MVEGKRKEIIDALCRVGFGGADAERLYGMLEAGDNLLAVRQAASESAYEALKARERVVELSKLCASMEVYIEKLETENNALRAEVMEDDSEGLEDEVVVCEDVVQDEGGKGLGSFDADGEGL